MEEHSYIALLGCAADIWQDGVITAPLKERRICNSPQEMKFILPFINIIAASSFFVCKEFLEKNGILYRPYLYAEDFGLLLDVLRFGEIFSLQEALIAYRIYPQQTTQVVGAELKRQERISVQTSFLDMFSSECRDIFRMAFTGGIISGMDMEKMEKAILQYAEECGLGHNENDLAKKRCVQDVFREVYDWQKTSMELLFAFLKSPLKSPFWFLKKRNLSLLKQSVL